MIILNKRRFFGILVLAAGVLFILNACSSIPFFGKKKEKETSKAPQGNTVKVDEMEKVKGVTPEKTDQQPAARKPAAPAPAAKPGQGRETSIATVPTRPFSSPLPFFQMGYKKKIVVLGFENKTTYKDEMIGEAVAKKISDKLEATQRVIVFDGIVMTERLNKEGITSNPASDPTAMKQANRLLGIQAFVSGAITDVSLLSSKKSEDSDEEVSFATSKIEVRLMDASTGNLLKTFIGRSPIFGTRESGENSRGKAILKAVDSGLDDIMEGFLRYLDLLEWSTSIAKIEGDNVYLNAGKMSGLRIGDTLEVYEPGSEVIHPATKLSLGWTAGKLKGAVRVGELFGVDAAAGKIVQGQGFDQKDLLKSTLK